MSEKVRKRPLAFVEPSFHKIEQTLQRGVNRSNTRFFWKLQSFAACALKSEGENERNLSNLYDQIIMRVLGAGIL